MKEMIKNVERFLVLVTIGALGETLFTLFRIFGRIEIQGDWSKENLMPSKGGLIVGGNHSSLWEPGLLPFLWVLHFLFSFSFKFVPFSTPDKINFFNKWWFWAIRLFCIPIDRERGRTKGLRELIKNVNQGKIVILFPEGGRTHKGDEFKIIKKGEIIIKKKDELTPEDNNLPKIRRFQRGFSALLKFTNADILPIWTEGGDRVIPNKSHFPRGPYFLYPDIKAKTIIKIGKRIKTKDIFEAEDELLKLSQNETSAP